MKKTIKIALVLALCVLTLCMTACSSTPVKLSINDMGVKTEFEANTSMTVEEALKEAAVTLSAKDETVPAKDEKITEDLKEIVVKRYAKVTIVHNTDKKVVELVGGTVEDAIKKSGIKLNDNEAADTDVKSYVKDGMTINIVKKFNVTLTADGKTEKVTTTALTVKDLLSQQQITLGKDDEVSPKLETKLTEGAKVVVKRVEYKEEKRTEKIDYSTKEQYSDSLPAGTSEVTQQGAEGSKEVTYKVKYVDGKEASKEAISEKVIKEPVDKIVTYSSQSSSSSQGGSGSSSSGGKTVVSKVPVYDCDGSGHGYYEITYSDGTVEYQEF